MKLAIYYERLGRIGQKPIVYLACRTGILFCVFQWNRGKHERKKFSFRNLTLARDLPFALA